MAAIPSRYSASSALCLKRGGNDKRAILRCVIGSGWFQMGFT